MSKKYSKSYVPVKTIDTNGIKTTIVNYSFTALMNYESISRNGLMINPPNKPVYAQGFGKGIYFADIASSAVHFCGCENETGSLLVRQVALGVSLECYEYINDLQLQENKHSARGMGKIYPNANESIFILIIAKCRWVNRSLTKR